MKKPILILISILALLWVNLGSYAHADLINRGPFDGQFSEDFESYPNYFEGGRTETLAVAGGAGLFSSDPPNSYMQLWIIEPGVADWSLGDYGAASTHGGAKALGFYNLNDPINVVLELAAPANDLGFYFVTTDFADVSTMTVALFDEQGNQLGNDQILDSLGNEYLWAGWSSATGISSVRFTGNAAPVIDDLQISSIPEPTCSVLTLAGLLSCSLFRTRREYRRCHLN